MTDATAPTGPEWIDLFINERFDEIALLVELREYLFLQGPPERWPVSVVRRLQPAFDELQTRRREILDEARHNSYRLESHDAGLVGASLELKLAHIRHARQLVLADLKDGVEPLDPEIGNEQSETPSSEPDDGLASPRLPRRIPKWMRRFLRHMASLLAAADTILDSLGGRLAHMLKELKQLLEKLCAGTADELDLREP